MKKDYVATKFAFGIFDLGIAFLKGMIRNGFNKESKNKTTSELLEELDARVTDLEIQETKGNTAEDPEKKAKEMDQKVKIEVSQELGLFSVEPTSTVAPVPEKGSKEPHYICGKIIKAGDRLVLVSPPGSGKTAWAYHVGFALTEGRDPEFITGGVKNRPPQSLEYYDKELDDDDRCQRYLGYNASSLFHLHPDCEFRTFYYLLKDINERTKGLESDATVIIDNVYGVMPSLTTEDTRTFLTGLDIIQRRLLAKNVHLTIILVTHTTKEVTGPPRLKDVAGSAHFSRFAKSVMSLYSRPDGKTVLMTNKRRYKGDKNALVMQLSEIGYLHFEFVSDASVEESPSGAEECEEEENGSAEGFTHEMKVEMWRMNKVDEKSLHKISDYFKSIGRSISVPTVTKYIKEIDAEMSTESNEEEI